MFSKLSVVLLMSVLFLISSSFWQPQAKTQDSANTVQDLHNATLPMPLCNETILDGSFNKTSFSPWKKGKPLFEDGPVLINFGYADLNPYTSHYSVLYQNIQVKPNATSGTLTFRVKIDSQDYSNNTLSVGIGPVGTSSFYLGSSKQYTSLSTDTNIGTFVTKTITLNPTQYAGQCVALQFIAQPSSSNNSNPGNTHFLIDDVTVSFQ